VSAVGEVMVIVVAVGVGSNCGCDGADCWWQ